MKKSFQGNKDHLRGLRIFQINNVFFIDFIYILMHYINTLYTALISYRILKYFLKYK